MPISEATRHHIFRLIREEDISWSGSLNDVDFLSRLYDLNQMPSHDIRVKDAKSDIITHTVSFPGDWDKYWIFDDDRFNLLRSPDNDFLRFLCEVLNPSVRPDEIETQSLLKEFNDVLKPAGFVIVAEVSAFGKKRYRPRMIMPGSTKVEDVPIAISEEGTLNELSELPVQSPKILFLAASPKKVARLRLDEEAREIEHKILLAQKKDKLILVNKGAVRVQDLQFYLLQEKPTIVHFSSHGSREGRIVLEDSAGKAKEIPKEALARVFKVLKDNVRCVVLNACFSAEQAEAISETIDCVIGMSSSIVDRAAIAFSSAFYLAIASGRSVKGAFDQGVSELMLQNIPGEDIPKLISRSGTDASTIFIVK